MEFCNHRAFLIHGCGEMENNEHVWKGKFIHRNIDQAKNYKRNNENFYSAVKVYSDVLNLEGVIDLLEFNYSEYIIHEYKKGSPKNISTAWENDIIQVEALMYCFKEMNFNINYSYIYYAETKNKIKVNWELNSTSKIENKIADLSNIIMGKRRTTPEYSKKCDGCSLYNTCLPKSSNTNLFDYWNTKDD
ncbi:CRISPR-associated protein Cas4 [Pigmentibacter sp. JX0631]|uniref:CRISPR-associated protein Cas4 n=1 Tax=Pigmentibacter sp. JX0631 TaxID=2976982 RepID=UPI0024697933|nr:CRISPR-associated protein Cas4 [Pigmentibacter sp. JX0631]WGL60033.1 CRISPR-associated protein Cas4 [Pigmentibacter sp. JX0631]